MSPRRRPGASSIGTSSAARCVATNQRWPNGSRSVPCREPYCSASGRSAGRAVGHRAFVRLVRVLHVDLERRARTPQGLRAQVILFRILAGEHEHGVADAQFGVADATVVHDDRVAHELCVEHPCIPLDGAAASRQLRYGVIECSRAGCVLAHFLDDRALVLDAELRRGVDATSDRRTIGGAQPARSARATSRTDQSSSPLPSAYKERNALRARTSNASVACTVRPRWSATSTTGSPSR